MILKKYKILINEKQEYILEAYNIKQAKKMAIEMFEIDFPETKIETIERIWTREAYDKSKERFLVWKENNTDKYKEMTKEYRKKFIENHPRIY